MTNNSGSSSYAVCGLLSVATFPLAAYAWHMAKVQMPFGPSGVTKAWRFVAPVTACGLIAWLFLLQNKIARSEHEQLQLQSAYQELSAQHQQATDENQALRRQLAVQRDEAAKAAGLKSQSSKPRSESRAADNVLRDSSGGPETSGKVSLWHLPPEIDAVIAQRFGPLEIAEVQQSIRKGQSVYLVQGTTGDGRTVGAMITPEGTILTSKSEVLADALPERIASAIREPGGLANIEKAREICSPDGSLEYALSGQSEDGRKISLNISAEGVILSGDVERSARDLPEPVRITMAQTAVDRSPTSVHQISGAKGTFYEIGFGSETERVQMVIDGQGRMISLVSKARFESGQHGEKPSP